MHTIFDILRKQDGLKGYQVQFIRRDTQILWVSLNAKAYKDKSNQILYIEGFISDITEQKKAEQALQQSHEKLENRVAERTRELSSWVKELEQRNEQSALLRKMSEMVQVCHTADEIFKVMHQYVLAFFPGSSGQLFIFNNAQEHLEPLMRWGDLADDSRPVFIEDCWALRRDKPYLMEKNRTHIPCYHMEDDRVNVSLCLPMISQGDILGRLHLRFPRETAPSPSDHPPSSAQRLAIQIAQHISLALVNINLRESLKRQSIQDALTGLYNRRFLDESMKREFSRMIRHQYSISLGVAVCPLHGQTLEQVLARSDQALYQAKTAGRDRVEWISLP